MENILQHLQTLLYQHSSVVVPNLGAFTTHYESAKVVEGTRQIYPPAKTVGFSERLIVGDGLLVNYVARAENISISEAKGAVRNFATSIKQQLSAGENAYLSGIGTLSKTLLGGVQLTTESNANYALSSFGLKPATLPNVPISTEWEVPEEEEITATAAIGTDIPSVGAGTSSVAKKPFVYDGEVVEEEIESVFAPANAPKKTVSDVLTENMQKVKQVVVEPARERINTAAVALPTNEERNAMPLWKWLLPLLVFVLGVLLFAQLLSSGKKFTEVPPFSYLFGGEKTETVVADNTNSGEENTIDSAIENADDDIKSSETETDAATNNDDLVDEATDPTETDGAGTTDPRDKFNENTGGSGGNNSGSDANSNASNTTSSETSGGASSTNSGNSGGSSSGQASGNLTPPPSGISVNKAKANEYVDTNQPVGYY
ncbi:MAG: hypothetical protein ACPGXL_09875, partial [Chitinophagales bacterium]